MASALRQQSLIDSGLVGRGEVSRGEKMTLRGTHPESNITEYTLENVSSGFLFARPMTRQTVASWSFTCMVNIRCSCMKMNPSGVDDFICKHLTFLYLVSIKITTRLFQYY